MSKNFGLVIELEKELHSPEVRLNKEKISSLLADDFVEIGASGKRYSKTDILERLSQSKPEPISSSDYEARLIGGRYIQVLYTTFRSEGEKTFRFLRSSIWRKEEDAWKMVFHQGTPSDR
ncbi:MAG: DUF4440 domain-containing protein [Bdellovibrionales bacterium]